MPVARAPARSDRGFWLVAFAFATAMAFTTLPTPLWALYARRDHFSSLVITVAFSAYALAVALSLFLAGHLSDRFGRRRVLIPALGLNLLAGVVFVVWPALPGLILARVLTGLGIGPVTATATAWLTELGGFSSGGRRGQRAALVAVGANFGGLGLGGLISGATAQWLGHALTLPFELLMGATVVALAALCLAPETHPPTGKRAPYRPQRVAVPADARAQFFAAATTAIITFALFGLVTSLAPSFLADVLHEHSRVLAGLLAFATFTAAAITQVLSGARPARRLLLVAMPALLAGLTLLALSLWLAHPSLALFVAGGVVAGGAAGLMFKGALVVVAEIAPADRRAEAIAGLFLAGYLGLSGPVIGLGALTQVTTIAVSVLAFTAALALGIVASAPVLLRSPRP